MKKILAIILLLGVSGLAYLHFSPEPELSLGVREVNSKTPNADTIYRSNGTGESKVYPAQVNYKTQNSTWDKIDSTLRQTAQGFVADKMPFEFTAPLRSTGTALFHNNNKWNNTKQVEMTSAPLDLEITALRVNDVPGEIHQGGNLGNGDIREYVVYRDAYDVSFTDGYFRPSFDLDYSSDVDFYRPVAGTRTRWLQSTVLAATKNVDVQMRGTSEPRGISMKPLKLWDMKDTGKSIIPIQGDIAVLSTTTDQYRLTKLIPESFFTTSTPSKADLIYFIGDGTPSLKKLVCFKDSNGGYIACTDLENTFFTEDADHGTLMDAYSSKTAALTWTAARDATSGDAGDTSDTAATLRALAYCDATNFQVFRSWLYFDTSGVGSDDTIDLARLIAWATAKGNDRDNGLDFIGITINESVSDTAIDAADYDRVTDVNGTNPHTSAVELKDGSDFTTTSTNGLDITNITTGAFLQIPLNATGTANIAKGASAVTRLGLTTGHDLANKPIEALASCGAGTQNYTFFDSAEGANSDPYLLIKFSSTAVAAIDDDIIQGLMWSEL